MLVYRKVLFFIFIVYFTQNIQLSAQSNPQYEPSASDYGGVGLLQTRSARFMDDTGFELGRSYIFPYERFTVNIQIIPILEGTFRYTSIENRSFSGNNLVRGTTFKDRAIDFKLLAWRESRYFPQIAIGFQDSLGTGLFSGEYIVGSKRWGDFDFSAGAGWGYAAGSGKRNNPFISLSEEFKTRSSSGRQGGAFTPGAWFSGEKIGFFGGFEYFTPLEGLTFKFEYDPHDYLNEPVGNSLISSSPYNFGFNYRPFHWVDLSLARERGEDFMFRVALRTHFNEKGLPKIDAPPKKLNIRETTNNEDFRKIGERPTVLSKNSKNIQPWFKERYRPSYLNKSLSNLKLALGEEGISINSISIQSELLEIKTLSKNYNARYIAQLALAYYEDEVDKIKIINLDEENIFFVSDLRSTSGTDYLFSQLYSFGWDVQEVQINSSEMSVIMVPLLGAIPIYKLDTNLFILPPEVNEIKFYENRNNKLFLVSSKNRKTLGYNNNKTIRNKSILSNKDSISDNEQIELKPLGKRILDQLTDSLTGSASFRKAFSLDRGDLDWDNYIAAKQIFTELGKEKIKIRKILFEERRVTVNIFRGRYRIIPKNIGRVVRIVSENISNQIEEITVVLEDKPGEIARFTIPRKQFEMAVNNMGSSQEIWHFTKVEGSRVGGNSGDIYNNNLYPDFRYSIRPGIQQHIGGGDQFYLHQVFANISTKIAFFDGFDVDAAIGIDLYNNFNRITTPADGTLPRVRSDIKDYLQRGVTSIRKLRANYMFSILPDLYGRLSAGYFETMYGGFSGEVLHRPFGARYAYGFDANYVRKREFDGGFGFQDYSVFTGHINLYYDIPFYGLKTSSHVGQYLAGDRGVTQILSRRFESGIVSGVWATATNVPAKVFGEGSFDKGFFITIPMDLFASRESLHHGAFGFRPLTKDGGQMVDIQKLHDLVGFNPSIVSKDWAKILE